MARTRRAFSGRTAWARSLQTPLREFLRTETGGAAVLLAAAVAALVWVNVDASSYDSFWETTLSIDARRRGGRAGPARVGEQRPDDVLLLRRRARGAARVRPGRAARAAAVRAAAARRDRRHGGGGRDLPRASTRAARPRTAGASRCRPTPRSRSACSRSSGPRFPDRLRAFMLTVVVVDDIVALVVIATVYTEDGRRCRPLLAAVGLFGAVLVARVLGVRARARLPGARGGGLGGAARVGRRAGRRRARDGPAGLRLPGRAVRARARDRALPRVPRAADAGARPLRPARGSGRRSRRTSGCSSSTTRGRAT